MKCGIEEKVQRRSAYSHVSTLFLETNKVSACSIERKAAARKRELRTEKIKRPSTDTTYRGGPWPFLADFFGARSSRVSYRPTQGLMICDTSAMHQRAPLSYYECDSRTISPGMPPNVTSVRFGRWRRRRPCRPRISRISNRKCGWSPTDDRDCTWLLAFLGGCPPCARLIASYPRPPHTWLGRNTPSFLSGAIQGAEAFILY